MSRKAFTLLELIIVMIIIGILAAMALPRMDRDVRQEAADNILSAIRYTQQLALNDNKASTYNKWQKRLWAIRFTSGTHAYYTIGTDDNNNSSISIEETAVDPANGKYFYNSSGIFANKSSNESPAIFLGDKYGINTITFSGGCSNGQDIAFDHLGRPFNNIGNATRNYAKYMSTDCTISFQFANSDIETIQITVEKQTGHAFIVGQPNS